MTLDDQTKGEIRTILLLELNNCFTKVSKRYEQHDDLEKEFLQTLISSIKVCIDGAEKNSD